MPEDNSEEYIARSPLPSFDYLDISVGEYLSGRIAAHDPDLIAFLHPEKTDQLTYGEFHRKCQQFASALVHKLSITKNDLVIFFADNSIEHAVALFGTIYLGLPFVPVPPAHGPYELSDQIAQCNATVLVCGPSKRPVIEKMLNSAEYSPSVKPLKVIVEIDALLKPDRIFTDNELTKDIVYTLKQILTLSDGRLLQSIPHFAVKDLAAEYFLICFTSGTTGPPKGAIHSHRSYMALLQNYSLPEEYYGLKLGMTLPLGHISGCVVTPQALDVGMTLVLFDNLSTDYQMRAIDRCRIDHYALTLSALTEILNTDYQKQFDLTCLKQFRFGGSKYPANLLQQARDKFQVELFEIYGATEFMGMVNPVKTNPKLLGENYEPGNLGPVTANVELKVVSLKSGQSLPALQSGELCFRGRPCFIGYLNNEEATRNTIDQNGWYHSGDVGYYDERGCIFITDRIKELIKFRIWSLIPAEIEQFLHRHPAVASVCVVGVPHLTDGYLIRAYVQRVLGKSVTEQELMALVQENLGFQKRLRAGVRFIAEMPRTSVGKVDRQHFKRLVKDELITEQVE